MPTEPCSIEAEQAVIGAILADETVWDTVSEILRPEHFFDPGHRIAFVGIRRTVEDRMAIDAVTVHDHLAESERSLAPFDLLASLQAAVGTTANAAAYAETVRRKWALRQRKRIAESILCDDDEDGNPEEKLTADASRLLAIQTGNQGAAQQAGKLLFAHLEALEREVKEDRWARQIPTGIGPLDKFLGGLEPGELVLIGARPGVGKSALAIAITEHAGSLAIPTGVFWLEDYARQWASRVLARRAQIPYTNLRHGSALRADHWERLGRTVEQTSEWPIYLDDTHGLTAKQMAQRMRRLHREHGCRLFVADHLGEVRLDRTERWGDRHDLAMGDAMRVYRDTAADLGAVPVLMAQLGREGDKRGGEPRLTDIYGSGIAEQVVRVAVFLTRDGDNLNAHIVKNTNGPKPPGPVALDWDGRTVSIRSASRPASASPLQDGPEEDA